jgi:hypothetical protein
MYDPRYGLCFTFNASQVSGYESVVIDDILGNPSIEMNIYAPKPMDSVYTMIHSPNDILDANDLYRAIYFPFKHYVQLSISKKRIQSLSTVKNPCQELPKKSCRYKKLEHTIDKKYNCTLPFERFLESNVKNCNVTIIKDVLEHNLHKAQIGEECFSKQACHQAKYSVAEEKHWKSNYGYGYGYLRIKLTDPVVEVSTDLVSYDLQSLIGECGGTLGLTLGISVYSGLESVIYLLKKIMVLN